MQIWISCVSQQGGTALDYTKLYASQHNHYSHACKQTFNVYFDKWRHVARKTMLLEWHSVHVLVLQKK